MSLRNFRRLPVPMLCAALMSATPAMDFNNDDRIALGEYITAVDRLFAKADTNLNGRIDGEEGQALSQHERKADLLLRFAAADMDRDGYLSADELLDAEGFGAGNVARGGDPTDIVFGEVPGDTALTPEERNANLKKRLGEAKARIARARVLAGFPAEIVRPIDPNTGKSVRPVRNDMDYDGVVTIDDYRSTKIIKFHIMDEDENGQLSRDEWPRGRLFSR